MFSTEEAHKHNVFVRTSKGGMKKLGRIRAAVFHPTELRLVGYAIKRPDALLMVKRQDAFVAYDRMELADNIWCVIDARDSWDKEACKRLGVNYDLCIIWENMPVRTTSGRDLGLVKSVVYDEKTGEIDHIDISSNVADKFILGSSNIARAHLHGYKDGAIVVDDISAIVEESGGAAAAAGEAWANAKHVAVTETKKATAKAGEAINDGAYKAGEVIGSVRDKAQQAAKEREDKQREAEARGEYVGVDKAANLFGKQLGRASGMFKGFKDEFDKASKGD